MKKPFWRNLSDVLFQNALLIILIIYFTRITFAINKLTGTYYTSEMEYLSSLAVIVLIGTLIGQIYCLKRGSDQDKDA